jgi:branched-chain amino acid aminotransferase
MLASLNGSLLPQQAARVPVTDRGFLYGDAVFETVAVYGGRAFRLDAHLDRLAGSMQALRFAAACDREALRAQVARVLEANRMADGLVRLCITRGSGPRGLGIDGATDPIVLVSAHPPSQLVLALAETGATLVVSQVRRIPPECLPAQAKHANCLNGILAHSQAADAGAYEALMLTPDGQLAECSFSNLFFVRDGRLHTPSLALGILPGITRAATLEMAHRRGLVVVEGVFDLQFLRMAEEVFVTNTSAGVMPVARIDDIRLPAPGPVTAAVRDDYWRLVQREAGAPWRPAAAQSASDKHDR